MSNSFSGGLPSEWATAGVSVLSLEGNALSGPAFPPAWLRPGALPRLNRLQLAGNVELGGTLPAGLAWPQLHLL